MKKIVIRARDCTGCRVCESTCALFNEKVNDLTRSRVQVVKNPNLGLNKPVLCYQCTSPPCVAPCPVDAIKRDEESGVVRIDYDLCIGCELCAAECPFSAIITLPDKVIKCELCNGDPQCVKYCETRAIEYVDPRVAYERRRGRSAQPVLARLKADLGLPAEHPAVIRR
jgi:Fe-S-cluster-containing hydrogenase component 2